MKIGIYSNYLSRSVKTGVEEYAEQLIARMVQDTRHDFYLISKAEIEIVKGRYTHIPLRSGGKLKPLLGELRAINKRYSFDAMFMPTQYTYFSKKQETTVTAFDVAWKYFPYYFPLKKRLAFTLLTSYAVKKAKNILAISEATKRDLVELYCCDSKKIAVIPLGYDKARFNAITQPGEDELLAKLSLRHKEYILFLGTLQKRKNLIHLIKAYNELETDLPLILAGGPGWFYEEIRAEIQKSPKKAKIIELGYIDENIKPALYRNCRAFVYPSLYEGFGLPVLEAMACGCRVLTSNVSSLPEVAGTAAVLVDPNDIASIRNGIAKILEDGSASLETLAIQRAGLFSWDQTAQKTIECIMAT